MISALAIRIADLGSRIYLRLLLEWTVLAEWFYVRTRKETND